MTSDQYIKAVAKLNLTPYSAAAVLGISKRQSYRLAQGESPVQEPVARLLHMLHRHGIPPEWR